MPNLIERVAALGRQPKPAEAPTPKPTPAQTLGERLSQIVEEALALRRELEEATAAEQQASARAVELSERAARGEAAQGLQAALKEHADANRRLGTLRATLETLKTEKERLNVQARKECDAAAKQRYSDAVMEYARACIPLLKLSRAVQDAAGPAGVLLTATNSKHLLFNGEIVIGGAVVDVKALPSKAEWGRADV